MQIGKYPKSTFKILHFKDYMSKKLCVCTDIDECKLKNGGCTHTCSNSPGGHTCHCPPPLLLGTDNLTCTSKSDLVLFYFVRFLVRHNNTKLPCLNFKKRKDQRDVKLLNF